MKKSRGSAAFSMKRRRCLWMELSLHFLHGKSARLPHFGMVFWCTSVCFSGIPAWPSGLTDGYSPRRRWVAKATHRYFWTNLRTTLAKNYCEKLLRQLRTTFVNNKSLQQHVPNNKQWVTLASEPGQTKSCYVVCSKQILLPGLEMFWSRRRIDFYNFVSLLLA